MRWTDVDKQTCSIARALSELGDRWTLLLIRDAFMRAHRFEEFVQRSGAARNVVADRLDKLVQAGIFERMPYQTRPERHEYRLTEKGLDLYPVIMTLLHWGDRWHDDGAGPPTRHRHRSCGKSMHGVVSCSACGEPLNPEETQVTLRDPTHHYWEEA